MEFILSDIQNYAELMTSKESEELYELNRFTNASVMKPRMLSGHLQGRFLSFISHISKPKYVLDIGTYTGYSALCLAEGLTSDGKLYTLDNNEEVMAIAKDKVSKTKFSSQIDFVLGNALENIVKLNSTVPHWDLIWIDADKASYQSYYDVLIDKMQSGGILLADNVLWSGKVLNPEALEKDIDTKSLHHFNESIMKDNRVDNLLLPIRDGIMMIRKK